VFLLLISWGTATWGNDEGQYLEQGVILVADPRDDTHYLRVGFFESSGRTGRARQYVYDTYQTVVLV